VNTLPHELQAIEQLEHDYAEYERMLTAFALPSAPKTPGPVALFATHKGTNWDRELMVCGRATYGNEDCYASAEPGINEEERRASAIRQMSNSRDGLQWVLEAWGRTGPDNSGNKYNTATSAFWRVTKRLRAHFVGAHPSEMNWSTYLAWTNLYRIVPVARSNPSTKLQRVQREFCTRLLAGDLAHLRPKRLLLMTGRNWSDDVVPQESMTWINHVTSLVDRAGHFKQSDGSSVQVVVAKHPQGKPENQFVSEVIKAFDTLS
jgi:hypothetical protein